MQSSLHNGGLMIGISGYHLDVKSVTQIESPFVSGVILFARNIESKEQLLSLTAAIHALRPGILIAIDQEGGRVRRLREGFASLSSLTELAGKNEEAKEDIIATHVNTLKSQLDQAGVDFSFTPVLDIDGGCPVIGDRAFAKKAEKVSEHAQQYLRHLDRVGLPAIGKHFPGHGSVELDSHLALPEDMRTLSAIAQSDLLPFYNACKAKIPALMMAHVVYSKVCDKPAGFSSFWVTTVLREWWNYQGVIFSDDLCMTGAEWAGDIRQRVKWSLDAGCDVLLVCKPEYVDAAIKAQQDFSGVEVDLIALRLALMPNTKIAG